MTQDQQTFKRALNAALVGGAAQVALTTAMALVGIYAQAPAIHAAALYLLGGTAVWITLAVLFHQQRQERIEALEAEQLAATDAATAAIFNEAGDQLRDARKRLNNLVKYWLNLVSLLLAAYLLAVGGWYLYAAAMNEAFGQVLASLGTTRGTTLQAEGIRPDAAAAAVGVVALGVAFVSFLVARYVAGMTQVRSWQPLRAGAGQLMGAALLATGVALAAGLRYFGVAVPGFVLLAYLVPAAMLLLGVEIVLSFTFGLYRPRKPGEAPRPAFESRTLGWLSRPESIGKIVGDTINYQFGFEISSSWFYRLIARAIVPLLVLGSLVLLGLSSLVVVGPHQEAAILRFGRLERIVPAGHAWKLPWPIERAAKHDVYQVQSMDIASSSKEHLDAGTAVLWTNEHGGTENNYFVTPDPIASTQNTADAAENAIGAGLVGARVTVHYRIADLLAYLDAGSAQKPQELFRRQAEGVVSRYFATHEIESLLSSSRATAGSDLRQALQPHAEKLGLTVLAVSLTSLHPPQKEEVAQSFLSRIEADVDRQATIEEAQKQAVTTLTAVAGSRERAVRITDAIAEADRLQAQLNEARGSGRDDAASLAEQLARQQASIEQWMDEAGGQAIAMIHQARAERWTHALGEQARLMSQRSLYPAYQQSPEYFRAREYFNVLVETLADPDRPVRKIILTTPGVADATVRLNLEDEGASLGTAWDPGK